MNAQSAIAVPAVPADPPSVWQTVRRFPRPVWCLLVGMFINRFGTFVIPFLALHITRLGYSAAQSGLALGAYGAGNLIASAVGGHLADTIGSRRTIVLSMVCGAASMMLLSQAQDLWWLIALAFFNGLIGEFYRPASSALLANLVEERRRVTAFAAYRFAINAGFAFGPAVAGLLARHSYFWLFLGDAATSLLYGAIAFALLPRDETRASSPPSPTGNILIGLGDGCRAALQDPRFRRLLLANLVVAMVFVQILCTFGLEVKASGLSERIYGLVLGLNGLLIVLFEIPLTSFTQRRSATAIIGTGFALIGSGAALCGWARAPWQFGLAMGVFTAGEMFSMPVALAYVASLAPDAMRGRYLGVYGLTWSAALTFGPALGTWVYSSNPGALWIGCGVVGIVGALIVVTPLRQSEHSPKATAGVLPAQPPAAALPPSNRG